MHACTWLLLCLLGDNSVAGYLPITFSLDLFVSEIIGQVSGRLRTVYERQASFSSFSLAVIKMVLGPCVLFK